jgi:hypothetical protein
MTGTIFAVSKLDDLSYRTEFTGGECFVRDVATNALAGKGRRVRGLYKLDYLEIPLALTGWHAQRQRRPAPRF